MGERKLGSRARNAAMSVSEQDPRAPEVGAEAKALQEEDGASKTSATRALWFQ